MHPTIRGVVFDMDDVLCRYDFDRRMAHMAVATGLSPAFIREAIWDSGFDEEADAGKYDAQTYLDGCRARLGVALSREDWVAARAAAMTPDPAMLALARKLAGNLAVATLTNNGLLLKEALPEVFPEVIDIFGARAFVSAQFGCAKPNPRVFHAVAQELDLDPASLLFIDDSADYVSGARAAGLQTHHFVNADDLETELISRGLL